MKNEILRIEQVLMEEDDMTFLENFNLHIFQGEIMGLVCINGNGREALIRLITQNVPIHYGRVYFQEELVNSYQHSSLIRNKVAVIEQKSHLIEDLSVADNVFVLRRGFKKYYINNRVLNDQVQRLLQDIEPDLDGNGLAANLSPYEKCVIELLRASIAGAKLVIIMDISNSVSAADLIKFHNLIRFYSKKGMSFLYVCNHHEEAFKVCDRMSLMKDGKILKVFDQKNFTNENMAPFYIGEFSSLEERSVLPQNKESILSFCDVCTDALNRMSFSVGKGECTVLFDTDNTALPDIIELMKGSLKADSGNILLEGTAYRPHRTRTPTDCGLAFVGEHSMIFKEMNYINNLCFLLDQKRNGIRLNQRIMKSIIREYEPLVGSDIHEENVMNLKKQEIYDLIFYRIQLFRPKIVFYIQPFANADLYLRRHLIDLISQLKKQGTTVIFLSVNIADSLVIADKLILIKNGRFNGEYYRPEFKKFSSEGLVL